MQDEMANLVFPVFTYGLQIKDLLDQGRDMSIEEVQSNIKGMLLSETEARRWVDYGGDADAVTATGGYGALDAAEREREREKFLGVRYALVCWLDELFILESAWSTSWNEQKLEAVMYETNDRAWKFWEQAQRAEKRPTRDGLEAFFLCVMLGFRGEYAEDPARLDNWVSAARAHLNRGLSEDWPYPPELEPPIHVPPRHGRARLQKMVFRGGMVLLIALPFIVAFLIQQLGR